MTTRQDLIAIGQHAFGSDRRVSPELVDLVLAVCEEIERQPTSRDALRLALERLLRFLASPDGRTDANCRAVDLFFCVPEEFGWEVDWSHLPEEFQEILADLGGALHDTIGAADIARRFESTPEQLLERVLNIVP